MEAHKQFQSGRVVQGKPNLQRHAAGTSKNTSGENSGQNTGPQSLLQTQLREGATRSQRNLGCRLPGARARQKPAKEASPPETHSIPKSHTQRHTNTSITERKNASKANQNARYQGNLTATGCLLRAKHMGAKSSDIFRAKVGMLRHS